MYSKHLKHSHISERKFREILRYFCFALNARTTSILSKISRQSVNKIFTKIRKCIADYCEQMYPLSARGQARVFIMNADACTSVVVYKVRLAKFRGIGINKNNY
jgi:hypothetical protein